MQTTENIFVDGELNEFAWQMALPVIDFFRIEPRQGGSILHPGSVRVLFDKKNIYFGVFCKDSAGKKGLRIQDLRRDFSVGANDNDAFYLQLDPQNLKRFCVSFQTTPYGNQADMQVFDDTYRDLDWDALWKVRTSITDSGYYAEFAIPFKSLRYDKENGDSVSWGITYARPVRRSYEKTVLSAWVRVCSAICHATCTHVALIETYESQLLICNRKIAKSNNFPFSKRKLRGHYRFAKKRYMLPF